MMGKILRHYRGIVDGDILKYLEKTGGRGRTPSFVGYEPFQQLLDLGLTTRGITKVKLVFVSQENEFPFFIEKYNPLEGALLISSFGGGSLQSARRLLTETKADYWEAKDLWLPNHRANRT
jgi:hypothetical protein